MTAPAASTPGRGWLITVEGVDGAGKTTQLARLASWLTERGCEVVVTREPGGAPGAEEIRGLLLGGTAGRWSPRAEVLLHSAARRDHLDRLILPALARGAVVLCDRFVDSTRAYQGYGHGFDLAAIDAVHQWFNDDLTPDLTLVFDLDPAVGGDRRAARAGPDRYESLDPAFHARVRAGFLAIARAAPARAVVIDAAPAIDRVTEAVCRAVGDRLGLDPP